MKTNSCIIYFLLIFLISCTENRIKAQNATSKPHVGGRCEGCESIFESPVSFDKLGWELRLPDAEEKGPKLEVSGTVYKSDGKTPAANVVMYVYHTDQSGNYAKKGNETGWGKRHGYIRGWLKTNDAGQYKIVTLRPASYPNSRIPAHIHCIVKEPEFNEYSIGEFLFSDDPFLDQKTINNEKEPGGNGVLTIHQQDGRQIGHRNIYLGKNVADYPTDQSLKK